MKEYYLPVVATFIVQRPFDLHRVSGGEVLKELWSGNFSIWLAGTDQIPVKYVKLVGGLLMSPFTHIINVCLSTRQFAHTRKTAARISPVSRIDHPKSEGRLPSSVPILPALSKVFERLVLNNRQQTSHIYKQSLLPSNVSSFRKRRSTTTFFLAIWVDFIPAIKRVNWH